MIALILPLALLILRIYNVAMRTSSEPARPAPQPAAPKDAPPFQRKPKDAMDFLSIATNAFMNEGKNMEEVKLLLKQHRLHSSNIDGIANKAEELYLKWHNELSEEKKAAQDSKIALLKAPLPIQQVSPAAGIKVTSKHSRGQGENFGALMGHERYADIEVRKEVYLFATLTAVQEPVKTNGPVFIGQSSFKSAGGSEGNPFIRTVRVKDKTKTVFPYLKTERVFRFQTKEIIIWENKDTYITEAEIKGIGNETFGIGFFATDYAINKTVYRTQPTLNIHIAGFALIIRRFDDQNTITPLAPDFGGYLPHKDFGSPSYINFVGKIMAVSDVTLGPDNQGQLLTLKFLNDYRFADSLLVDVFVNKQNIKDTEVTEGMTVEGVIWLQGEIADQPKDADIL